MGQQAARLEWNRLQERPANDDAPLALESAAPERSASLSEVLYGIRWDEHLPCTLPKSGVTASVATWQQVAPFFELHHAEVFGDQTQFLRSPNSAARDRYMDRVADVFLFEHEGRVVGTHICNPVDWSTYYVRHSMLLPEYQKRNIVPAFVVKMFDVLRSAGVERVEIDTSPSNHTALSAIARAGFVPCGTLLSERWGAQCRFVRHLDSEAKGVFAWHYCPSAERHAEGSWTYDKP